jgi:hypothetical protein
VILCTGIPVSLEEKVKSIHENGSTVEDLLSGSPDIGSIQTT